jgi:hypothetical protein
MSQFGGLATVAGARRAGGSWLSAGGDFAPESGVEGDYVMITGPQRRAARALVEWTREELPGNSGVDELVIEEFERRIPRPEHLRQASNRARKRRCRFHCGERWRYGVRLKLNRSEVRRIGVLENEGGIVGIDAVP